MSALFYLTTIDSKEEVKDLSKTQVLSFLVIKKVQANTLIMDQSNSKKTPLHQHKSFQFLFPAGEQNTSWTLLKKHEGTFVQTGTYSTKGLQYLLKEGIVSDQDFVWKSSFESWKRISVCSEFCTNPSASLEDLMDQMSVECKSDAMNPTYEYTVYKRKPIPFHTWSKWSK